MGRIWRRLLELDRPAPHTGPEEVQAFVTAHARWNFFANLMDGLLFWLGISFISATTIVPLFISKLTSSAIPVGLASMISQGGWYLPQLLTANPVEMLPRKRPVVANLGLFVERLPVWVLAVAALLAGRWPGAGLTLFLVAYAWRSLGSGAVGPAWQDMIATVIPVERRGRYFGLSSATGVGLGVAGSAASAWLLLVLPFPTRFVCIFALAAACITAGWFFVSSTREPARNVSLARQSQSQFLRSLPQLVSSDPPFRRFLVARTLLGLGSMGMGFVTLVAIRRWAITDSTVGIYTAVLLLGTAMGNLASGFLADRRGHKLSLEWSALAYSAAFVLACLAPAPNWYFAAFLLLGIAAGAVSVSGLFVVMEFCQVERRPTYCGIANTTLGLAYTAGPLLAAGLVGIDYRLLFGLSAAISVAAWAALRWWVHEPRWANSSIHSPN